MIRSALILIRTSMLQVLCLAGALTMLVDVLSSQPGDEGVAAPSSMPSLAPLPKTVAPTGNAAAALRVPLFDPERRPETLSGSIDDLRMGPAPPPAAAPEVAIDGVMVVGRTRRALLTVAGGHAGWSDVGTEVGGWRVTAVDANGVLLERDGQTLALTIADRLKNRSKPRNDQPSAVPGSDAPPTPDGAPPPPPQGTVDPLTPPDGADAPRP